MGNNKWLGDNSSLVLLRKRLNTIQFNRIQDCSTANQSDISMRLPTFLIVGAMKAGTTSLYQYLRQHPDIFMSHIKEPGFFSFGENEYCDEAKKIFPQRICTLDDYAALYQNVREERAIGEATTAYLDCPRAPERIKSYVPEAKLITILRDPAERAHSHFMFNKKLFQDLPTLEMAVEEESNRVIDGYSSRYKYLGKGFYHQQLIRYLRLFPADQMKILIFDDFKQDPYRLLSEVFAFLEVDETFKPDISIRYNTSGAWRSGAFEWIMKRLQPVRRIAEKKLPPALVSKVGRTVMKSQTSSRGTRQMFINYYREDILQLQDLLHRDLSSWLH